MFHDEDARQAFSFLQTEPGSPVFTQPSQSSTTTTVDPVAANPIGKEPGSTGFKEVTGTPLPKLQMKWVAALPLDDEVTPAPSPELVDTKGSSENDVDPADFLQQLQLQHQSRVPVSHSSDWLESFMKWFAPTGQLPCIIIVIVILLSAGSLVPKRQLGGAGDRMFLFHDPKSSRWIKVELMGRLPSGNMLLRHQTDGQLCVAPHGARLRRLEPATAEVAATFSKHVSYGSRWGFFDMADDLRWRLWDAQLKMLGKGQEQEKNEQSEQKSTPAHTEHTASKRVRLQHVVQDIRKGDAVGTLMAMEHLAEQAIEDIEEEIAEDLAMMKEQTLAVAKDIQENADYLEKAIEQSVKKSRAGNILKKFKNRFKTKKQKKKELLLQKEKALGL